MRHPTFDDGPVCFSPDPERPWEMRLGTNRCYELTGLPETCSAQEYITGHCQAYLVESLCEKINDGRLMPGKGTYKVPQPDRATCSDAYIDRVICVQTGSTTVRVEAVLIAKVTLYEFLDDIRLMDEREEWFVTAGEMDLLDEMPLPMWGAFEVYQPRDRTDERVLDDYLIPVMTRRDRQQESEAMLRVFYPEALRAAVRINPRVLAERMGLTVRYLPLVGQDNYYAMLFFKDATVPVVNKETAEITETGIQRDTIVINASTVGRKETIKAARAIIHECMHRYSHRLFQLFQQIYCAELGYLTCPISIQRSYGGRDDPLHWLETQADSLTLAAQIPERTMRKAADRLLLECRQRAKNENRAAVMRRVISRLSVIYRVSKKQMRKRLIDLGYEDAVGAYEWVNGGYVPAYCFAPGSWSRGQTLSVPERGDKPPDLHCAPLRHPA